MGSEMCIRDSVDPIAFTPELVAQLCHRHFGIGADGLIILMPHDAYDFEMVYYNSDGHRATMCGNGGRCILHFAHTLGVIKNETEFLAADGPHEGKIDDLISLSMNVKGNVKQKRQSEYFLDTGSPHYMVFTCLLYTSPSPRDLSTSRMPSSA